MLLLSLLLGQTLALPGAPGTRIKVRQVGMIQSGDPHPQELDKDLWSLVLGVGGRARSSHPTTQVCYTAHSGEHPDTFLIRSSSRRSTSLPRSGSPPTRPASALWRGRYWTFWLRQPGTWTQYLTGVKTTSSHTPLPSCSGRCGEATSS